MTDGPPVARVRRSRGFALVWLVPVAALAIVVWLGLRTVFERGPLITITFETADGLEAGRTKVRHKAVDVGLVESVTLAEDLSHVIVTARIDRSAEAAVSSTAKFWVVRPRLSPGGISGLNTLVSGAYLELEPGKEGQPQYEFKGLEEPPITTDPERPGRRFRLRAPRLGGLGQGAPIYHHGVVVGEVLGSQLTKSGDEVDIQAYVNAPYGDLVTGRTRFWNASGVSISAGPGGIKASVASLQALVAGGIEFDVLRSGPPEQAAKAGAEFRLFDDQASAEAEPWGPTARFAATLPGPIHGLADGAPVELKGSYVGRVTEVHLAYDPKAGVLSTPIVIELDPQRVEGLAAPGSPEEAAATATALMDRLVGEGLRARLGTENLLTGQRMITLDIDPEAPKATLGRAGDLPEIPAEDAGDIDSLARSATHALDAAHSLIGHIDQLVGSPQARETVRELNATLANLDKLTRSLDTDAPALAKSLRETSDAATRAFDVLGGEGGRGTDLRGLLHELQEAARSMRSLADMLQEHPEALLRGRDGEEK